MPLKKYRQYRAPSGFLQIGIHAWHQLSSSFSLLPSYFFISFPQSVWVVASFVTHTSRKVFNSINYCTMSAKRISFPFFVLFCPFSLFIELHLVRLVRFPFCFSQLKRILDSNFSINNSNVCNAKVSLDFSWATNKSQVLGNKQISNEREDEIEKGHRFHGIKSVNSAKVSLFHPFCVCMSA